jgi:hypothetical protein
MQLAYLEFLRYILMTVISRASLGYRTMSGNFQNANNIDPSCFNLFYGTFEKLGPKPLSPLLPTGELKLPRTPPYSTDTGLPIPMWKVFLLNNSVSQTNNYELLTTLKKLKSVSLLC